MLEPIAVFCSPRRVSTRFIDVGLGTIILGLFSLWHARLWSAFPPDVDPINFVTALRRFDITIDSPHPPGYPLYVALARICNELVADFQAYQLLNLLLLLLAATALFVGLREYGERKAAWIASAVLLSHPLTLAATVVPESYISDACFGSCLFALCTSLRHRPRARLIGICLLFFVAGLFRVVSTVLLLPLCLVLVSGLTGRLAWRSGVVAAFCAVLSASLAWILTVQLAGGLEVYEVASDRVMGTAVRSASVFAGAPWEAHAIMVTRLAAWAAFATAPVMLGALILFGVGVWRPIPLKRSGGVDSELDRFNGLMLSAWLGAPLLFYAIVYFLKPTYLLIALPALAVGTGLIYARMMNKVGSHWGAVSVLVLIASNLSLYMLPTKSWPKPLYRHSHAFSQERDAYWKHLLDTLSPVPRVGSLLLWIQPTHLPIHAVRLLDWKDVAQISSDRALVQFVEPKTLQWRTPMDVESLVPAEFDRLVLVHQNATHPMTQVIELKSTTLRTFLSILSERKIPEL